MVWFGPWNPLGNNLKPCLFACGTAVPEHCQIRELRHGKQNPELGVFPPILTVLNSEYNRGYYNPYYVLLDKRGEHPNPEP